MAKSRDGLTAFELRVLKKCAAGRHARLLEGDEIRIGTLRAPATVYRRLARRGLVDLEDGRVVANKTGQALVARQTGPGTGGASPYAAQHRDARKTTIDPITRERATVNLCESPLAAMGRRKGRHGRPLLSPEQIAAGDRLRCDFEASGLAPRVTQSYAPLPPAARRGGAAAPDPTARQIDAQRRYNRALEAMGPGLSDVTVRVCCYLEGLEAAERALEWPTRSAKLVLSLALDRLVAHYAGQK